MKSRRIQRAKSLPINQSSKRSFFAILSHRLSLSSMRRSPPIRLYDNEEDDDLARVISPEIQTTTTPSRFSRRVSRFWSASAANQFQHDALPPSPVSPTYVGAAYVPRHAASDFSKTASNRLTMMAEADEMTLCSFNCRANRNTRSFSTDDGLDMDHRERALAALTTRHSTPSSEGSGESNNDYTLFLADAAASPDARRRRSAAAWAELEHRAAVANRRASGTDPLINRQSRTQSAYLGVPGSMYESSRPVSSVAVSIAEYIRPAQIGSSW
ncbi:hypothetical protein F66182_8398 [Fusarium sp. NRRL 66182]|nr:hypothetical protein F66182_8398 [Fusarium sp. NRRL 66182]